MPIIVKLTIVKDIREHRITTASLFSLYFEIFMLVVNLSLIVLKFMHCNAKRKNDANTDIPSNTDISLLGSISISEK